MERRTVPLAQRPGQSDHPQPHERLPTTWSHYLYLYDSNGSYLAGSSSGGDDGYPLSKLTYTPQKEGWYKPITFCFEHIAAEIVERTANREAFLATGKIKNKLRKSA